MPARSTIFVWLDEHQDFARLYTLARQIQIEDLMHESLEIADDSSKPSSPRASRRLRQF
jgi:hypothetical protein